MNAQRGHCPRCDAVGRDGRPCETPGCRSAGYGFVPAEFYRPLKEKPGTFVDPLIGRILGEHQVLGVAGKGGFGRVYRAQQLPLRRPVALKVSAPIARNEMTAEELSDQLYAEASALSRVSHPNVVTLIGYYPDADPAHVVIEYLHDGVTLAQHIRDLHRWGGEMDLEETWHILGQVLDGMQAAHEAGVVHRDLNPGNLMLQPVAGDHRHLRIFDFGLGKTLGDFEETEDARAMGTPEYIAPEQLEGTPGDMRSDLYSLGVLAFTLLEWRSPFFGRDRVGIVQAKRDPEFDPTATIADDGLTDAERAIYRKAMARRPSDRYRTVSELRVALQRLR
jgi:serine/threonine protein kinase